MPLYSATIKNGEWFSLAERSSTIVVFSGLILDWLLYFKKGVRSIFKPGLIVPLIVMLWTNLPLAVAGLALTTASITAALFSSNACGWNEIFPIGTATFPFLSNLNSTRP